MSGETESEILCWTRFWFRQRNCSSCESCWVKRILTKRPTGFNVFNRIKWQNWKPELVCGHFPTQIFLAFRSDFHLLQAFNNKKCWIVRRFSFSVLEIVTSLAASLINSAPLVCVTQYSDRLSLADSQTSQSYNALQFKFQRRENSFHWKVCFLSFCFM